jgi:hypothetical protein
MAFELHNGIKIALRSGTAVIADKQLVTLDTSGGGDVIACATNNVRPVGITVATVAASRAGAIHSHGNVCKAVAAASLGLGAEVGVASTNGNLGPISGASGVTKWAAGQALSAAAAGETFSFLVSPRQVSNLI